MSIPPYQPPAPFFKTWKGNVVKKTMLFLGMLVLALLLMVVIGFAVLYPRVGDVAELADVQLKQPLKVYTADGFLIGEFGLEKRAYVPIEQIPDRVKQAVLVIEDDRFYDHMGIDPIGIVRAFINNLLGGSQQGGSTITQQVARNFYLNTDKTYLRKIKELVLAYKIESKLSKDKILELYLNKIYLGQRAYGFSAAAKTYFNKELSQISIAEAAMLAGLPKAPSAYNPVTNPTRARQRQRYILLRMHDVGYINTAQYKEALEETLKVDLNVVESTSSSIGAEFVAEAVRNQLFQLFEKHPDFEKNPEAIYETGFQVKTTILKADQEAAYNAMRKGVWEYDRRYEYRGPEGHIDLTQQADMTTIGKQLANAFAEYRNYADTTVGVVWEVTNQGLKVVLKNHDVAATVSNDGLKWAKSWYQLDPKNKFKVGDVLRLRTGKAGLALAQIPDVEASFISINSRDGSIRAMVGGFDFYRNQFNHATQGLRQMGSSIKPFIYSAAVDLGYGPDSLFWDSPPGLAAEETDGVLWEPKNYGGVYTDEEMTMEEGLVRSTNYVAIDILKTITPRYAQEFLQRFGFTRSQVPAYYSMALGASHTTAEQLVAAYAVFANGGFAVKPYLISSISDRNGNVIKTYQPPKQAGIDTNQVLALRNVRAMNYLLNQVVNRGTGVRARVLGRPDMGGKTGTTNDSTDTWFSGYVGNVVAVSWLGFDKPKQLGEKETGSSLALPMWVDYMSKISDSIPINSAVVPGRRSE